LDVPGNWPPPRTDASMVNLDSKLYVFGGRSSGIFLNDLWYYNPKSNSWNNRTSSSVKPSYGHTAGVLNGKMFVFGGHNGEKPNNEFKFYDPNTGLWTTIKIKEFGKTGDNGVLESTAPGARYNHCSVSDGTRFWIFGGTDEDGNDLAETWVYDSETEKWHKMTDGPAFTEGKAELIANSNGKVLIFGGRRDGEIIGETWIYDAKSDLELLSSVKEDVDKIRISKNVTIDIIEIKSDNLIQNIEVFDLFGREVKSININNSEYTLNLTELTNGTYFIKVKCGERQEIFKILKV
jgi:hypothetical protein